MHFDFEKKITQAAEYKHTKQHLFIQEISDYSANPPPPVKTYSRLASFHNILFRKITVKL
jgi:hypothetical protein